MGDPITTEDVLQIRHAPPSPVKIAVLYGYFLSYAARDPQPPAKLCGMSWGSDQRAKQQGIAMSTQPNTNVTATRRAGGQRKLTAKVIETALPREKRYRIADTEVRGLYLSVEPSGAKSFIARGRVGKGRGARSADITIGSTDSVRLSDARDTALGHLVLMRSGQDPRRPTEAPRYDASVAAYIQSLVKRDVVSVPQVEMTLHRAVAGITTMKINELTRRDLVVIIDRIDGTVGAAAGKKTQSVLSAWLNWAANEDFLPANVLAGYRRTRKAKQPDQWTLHHDDLGGDNSGTIRCVSRLPSVPDHDRPTTH